MFNCQQYFFLNVHIYHFLFMRFVYFLFYRLFTVTLLHNMTNSKLTWFNHLTVQTNSKRERKFMCVGKYHLAILSICFLPKIVNVSRSWGSKNVNVSRSWGSKNVNVSRSWENSCDLDTLTFSEHHDLETLTFFEPSIWTH